jgi:hypothetical protein
LVPASLILDSFKFAINWAVPGPRASLFTMLLMYCLYDDYSVSKLVELGILKFACLILSF